ncbi:MAG: type VI secretion system baseplate subunit TssK, partial [Desulfobacteraceae bacterium]|nr:type VI secretion system baseplate subunit TssK [Desulfobacteraceae bacterium]
QSCLYGAGNIEIKEDAISNYSVQLDKGEFWFKDMTYTVVNDNAIIESRSFNDMWDEKTDYLIVYVGLKRHSNNSENVSLIKTGDSLAELQTRYVSDIKPEKVNDFYNGKSAAQIKKMTYLLKIFFHTETAKLNNYELIPVAKIERNDEDIRLVKEFIPPCISIRSSPDLFHLIKEIYNQAVFKGQELESYKQDRGVYNAEFGSKDMVYLLALRSFNRYIPILTHMVEGHDVHPCNAYLVLKQFIGELSSFSEKIDVSGNDSDGNLLLLQYNHEELFSCFTSAVNLISTLLGEITAGPEYVINFKETEESYFIAEMRSESFEGNNNYYLVVNTAEEVEDILDELDVEVKLGTKDHLSGFIDRALPGIKLSYLPAPPQELPRRRGSIYFRLDNNCKEWGLVEKEKSISLYWNNHPEDVRIEIMIARRR